MSLYGRMKGVGPTGFGYGSTAEQVTVGVDLSGKTVVITGVSSGLGAETARVLALRGAKVVGLARTEASAAGALNGMAGAVPVACELSEPASVRAAAATVAAAGPVHAVICNAGIMALPKLEQKYGYELQFFTNHVGHFILVTGLLDALTDDGRVVMLSSAAHRRAPADVGIAFDDLSGAKRYDPWGNYGQSKLANLLFARELARRFAGTARTANAVHPGVIYTNLSRHMPGWSSIVFAVARPLALKSVPEGAATQCYVATHPAAAAISGAYWADVNVAESSDHGKDAAMAERLWAETEAIVAGL